MFSCIFQVISCFTSLCPPILQTRDSKAVRLCVSTNYMQNIVESIIFQNILCDMLGFKKQNFQRHLASLSSKYYTGFLNTCIRTSKIVFKKASSFFLALTFVASAWSFVFSSPPQRPMISDFGRIFYPRFYPLHLFSYLNS